MLSKAVRESALCRLAGKGGLESTAPTRVCRVSARHHLGRNVACAPSAPGCYARVAAPILHPLPTRQRAGSTGCICARSALPASAAHSIQSPSHVPMLGSQTRLCAEQGPWLSYSCQTCNFKGSEGGVFSLQGGADVSFLSLNTDTYQLSLWPT